MPTEASDIAGPVREQPFPHKQILEPEVIYNRYTYVSNIKLAAQKKDGLPDEPPCRRVLKEHNNVLR
jgi:heat shock protein HspQ